MQKLGRRSVGGFNDALLGYHGVHPVSTERLAENWWDANLRSVGATTDLNEHLPAIDVKHESTR
jgi:hypothetical protein